PRLYCGSTEGTQCGVKDDDDGRDLRHHHRGRLEDNYNLGNVQMHEPELIQAYGGGHHDAVRVEWVDDASCNLVYPDAHSAKSSLLPQLVGKVGVGLGGDKSFMEATELQIRVATTAD
ncbi:hypothetical protein FOZ63_012446, partial [Perkinsus olseni]